MRIQSLCLGMVQTNCYLLQNEDTKEMIIVDPADSPEAIIRRISAMEGNPVAILLTHGHFDHIMAARPLADHYRILIYAHEAEAQLLADPALNLSAMSGEAVSLTADVLLKEGEDPDIPGFTFRVLHTPGHTGGSCCYYLYKDKMLMSGDTLFRGSCGRTDFPTSSYQQMMESLKRLINTLPGEVSVYPGHEDFTTIANEKRMNPFV